MKAEDAQEVIVAAQADESLMNYAVTCTLPFVKWYIKEYGLQPYEDWFSTLSCMIPYAIEHYDASKGSWGNYLHNSFRNRVIAHNEALYRKCRIAELDFISLDELPIAELRVYVCDKSATLEDMKDKLLAAMENISLDDRILLRFRYEDRLTLDRLAVMYGVSPQTISYRTHKALNKLRDYLK